MWSHLSQICFNRIPLRGLTRVETVSYVVLVMADVWLSDIDSFSCFID